MRRVLPVLVLLLGFSILADAQTGFLERLVLTRAGIGTAWFSAMRFENPTVATLGDTVQRSPGMEFTSHAWDADDTVSREIVWRCNSRPISGNSPSATFTCTSSLDGAAEVVQFQITSSAGTIVANGQLLTNTTTIGTVSNGTLAFTSDGAATVRNSAANLSASLNHRRAVTQPGTPRTFTLTESNAAFTNSSTNGIAFILPDNPTGVGLTYTIGIRATITSGDMSLAPNTGETLYDGTSTCSTLTATGAGSTLSVMNLTSGSGAVWVITAKTGTWTCNP